MEQRETKRLAYSILEFLNEEFRKPSTNSDCRESLEVAMQCLETAFDVNLSDTGLKSPKPLREMFRGPPSAPAAARATSNPDMFPDLAYIQNAMARAAATGTGPTAPPGAGPRSGSAQLAPVELPLGAEYTDPGAINTDQKKLADGEKNEGNEFMRENKFSAALAAYSKAIELDGGNAVYFCNRAAAHLKLENWERALRDCQIAIQLQPGYARAYARMGVIYSSLGKTREAYSCYLKAVELEPGNESYQSNLRLVTEALESGGESGDAVPPNFLAEVFQNPQLISMATQMLQDPNMQAMMRNIVGNLQGGAVGGPPGPPDEQQQSFDSILQMGSAIAARIRGGDEQNQDGASGGTSGDQDPGPSPPSKGGYDL